MLRTIVLLTLTHLLLTELSHSGSSTSICSKSCEDSNSSKCSNTCSSLTFVDCAQKNCSGEEKYVVCYFTNWAWYRSEPVKFRPENINASLCTHILYAFSILDTTTLLMKPSDTWADIDNKFFELVTAFKQKGIKVLLSIGGWNNSGGLHWSKLINNCTAQANFITNAVAFLGDNNFDGFDLDYEYPGCPQGDTSAVPSTDKFYFNKFASKLKIALNEKGLLLTAAASGGKKTIDACYNMTELCEILDWVNIMAYDYYSYADGQTGPNAPLCGSGSDWGVYETVTYYMTQLKCPASKLVLGVPFYGKSYTMKNSANPKFGVAVSGPGTAGTYTNSAGTLAFYEICLLLNKGWKSGHDDKNGSYAYHDTEFVSYDSQVDLITKSCLINKNFNLKGAMFWALDYDDFNNICGNGSYPLLKTLNQQLRCFNSSEDSCE